MKKNTRFIKIDKLIIGATLAFLSFSCGSLHAAVDAGALPTNGVVVGGTGTEFSTVGNNMTVDIAGSGNRVIINYDTFNIGKDASVTFNQTDANAVVLNRVNIAGPQSEIWGALNANGNVYIVNPAGVLFGAGATINVGSLVAAAGDISDADFNAGLNNFMLSGTLENQADFSANGVYLLGKTVKNSGNITTNGKTVVMASGESIQISEAGTGISVVVTNATSADKGVENSAKIVADLPDLLKDIELKCKKLSKAEDVVKYLEGVQNSLNKWAEPDDAEITRLPQMAFSKDEIEKILQSVVSGSRPCLHMRFLDSGDNPFLYADAARGLFSGLAVLNIFRRDRGIIDIIVGEPDARSMFSLKASLKSIPILDDLSVDSRMYENAEFQKAMKLVGEGKAISLKEKSSEETSAIPLKKYARFSACIISVVTLFVALLFGAFHFFSSSPEPEEINESPEYSIEIKTNDSVENSPIEDVWKNLLAKTRGWVATTKKALTDKKVLEAIRSNKDLNDKFLLPFLYGAKKFNNYELSEIVDFGDVDLSYAMEHPGSIIKNPSTQKKLREMLSLLLQIKSAQQSWNGEKLFAEETDWLKHDGFISLSINLPMQTEWIYRAAEISTILTKLDFIVRRTNEIDSMMPQFSSDAGFEKISSDFFKSRAQVKSLEEVDKLLELDYAELSKAFNFLKNGYNKRCDIAEFSKSKDFKNTSAKTVDERVAAILKYEKILPEKNPIDAIKFSEEKAKIDETFKTLFTLATTEEIEVYSKEFSALQAEFESLRTIPQIAKNFNKIKNNSEIFEKKLLRFSEQLEQFASERGDIKKWALNAKSAEILGDEVVRDLWRDFKNEYIGSLDLDSINENLNLKLETIKNFNRVRDRYETLSKNPYLKIKEFSSLTFKEEVVSAFNVEKKAILKTYLKSEDDGDFQKTISSLKASAEKYLFADSLLKKIFDSLERPNFAANSIVEDRLKATLESVLENPSEKTFRVKSALKNLEALDSINDTKTLLKFANDEKNEKTVRLEYYKKACATPYLKGIENSVASVCYTLKNSVSEEMLKYLNGANFAIWKSALDFYRQKEIRNLDTVKLFELASRLDLSEEIAKSAELRYESIIASKLRNFENVKSEKDLRAAIDDAINALSVEGLNTRQAVEILKSFDVRKALTPDEKLMSSSGPASVGWKSLSSAGAKILKLEKDSIILEFVLCEKVGARSFYIQRNETSVDEFLKTTLASPDKEKILSTLPDWKYEDFDDVNGPVSWILSEKNSSYKIRKNWITDSNDVGNSVGEAPSKNSPMNWISFSSAKQFAKIVGCRLPSQDEYSIAFALFDNSKSANLRDKKWSELFEKYKKQNAEALAPRWQDGGIFDGGEKFPSGEKANSIKEESDNFAWFAPKSKQEGVENLFGNLWEYTAENSLFGYSALSPWKLSRNNPFKKNTDENKHYCDVGMRLCFSAPIETPSRIFFNILTQLPRYK